MREARVRFLGHSTIELSVDGVLLLTDPVLRPRLAHLRHHQPWHAATIRPPAAVLISHIHQDHLDFPSLRRLGPRTRLIVPTGAAALLRRRGYRNAEELPAGGSTRVDGVQIRGVPAHHGGWRPPFGPTAACIGFVVHGSQSVYFAGDTALFGGMQQIGPVDVALLPVWGWGPTLGPGHMNPRDAAQALRLLRPRLAIPVHWGALFPLGLGRWRWPYFTRPPRQFAEYARRLAPAVRVVILQPGESLTLTEGWQPC